MLASWLSGSRAAEGGVLAPPACRRQITILAECAAMEREEETITGGTLIERGWIHKIKLGLPVPGAKIVERRGKGLQAIRRYLLSCLSQIDSEKLNSSLVVRWT